MNCWFLRCMGPFPAGIILHSYMGSAEMVPEFAKLGSYFSFSGFLMSMEARKAKRILKMVIFIKFYLGVLYVKSFYILNYVFFLFYLGAFRKILVGDWCTWCISQVQVRFLASVGRRFFSQRASGPWKHFNFEYFNSL